MAGEARVVLVDRAASVLAARQRYENLLSLEALLAEPVVPALCKFLHLCSRSLRRTTDRLRERRQSLRLARRGSS